MNPYRTAFLFCKTGTYVSFTYKIVLARTHVSAAESTHEKKSNEDEEHPYRNGVVGPPPVKVLQGS